MLRAWARFVVRFKWLVLVGGITLAAGFAAAGLRLPAQPSNKLEAPGTDTARALAILREQYPEERQSAATLVVFAPGGVEAPAVRRYVEALTRQISELPEIRSIGSPYAEEAALSADGTALLVPIRLAGAGPDLSDQSVLRLIDLVAGANRPGIQLELSGELIERAEHSGSALPVAIALAAGLVLLIILLGPAGAGLPILAAIVASACGLSAVLWLSRVTDVSPESSTIGAVFGIAVGINSSLFLVARFREACARGEDARRAAELALSNGGKVVLTAGAVVVVALLSLGLLGIPYLAVLGVTSAFAAAIATIGAISIIPALLAVLGRGAQWPAQGVIRPRAATEVEHSPLYRFSLVVQRFPVPAFLVAGSALLALAFPLLQTEHSVPDASTAVVSTTSRRAYDLQAETFGQGSTGTLTVVVTQAPVLDASIVARVSKALAADEGVASVSSARISAAGTTAVFSVVPAAAPQSAEAHALVARLREETIPAMLARGGSDATVLVTGPTATAVDIAHRVEARMAIFFGVLVALSTCLLGIQFRSVAIPFKAAILNLGTAAASLGVAVAVFQWGWGARLIGLDRAGPQESFIPIFLFAALFGLTMVFEVFRTIGVRERFLVTRGAGRAIAFGLASDGRLLFGASAALMVVFASCVVSDDRVIKEFGLAMAVAVVLDATIVRLVIAPAAMQILGQASWRVPGWLDDRLPGWVPQPEIKFEAPPEVEETPSRALQPVQS